MTGEEFFNGAMRGNAAANRQATIPRPVQICKTPQSGKRVCVCSVQSTTVSLSARASETRGELGNFYSFSQFFGKEISPIGMRKISKSHCPVLASSKQSAREGVCRDGFIMP